VLDPRKSKKMVNGNPSRESQKNILGVLKKSCSYACTTCNKQIFSPQSTPAHTQPRKHADDLLTPMGVGCLMEAWRCHLHAPKRVGHICSEKTHTTKKIFSAIVVVSQSLPAKHHLWIGDKEIMSRKNLPGLKKGEYLSIRPPVDLAFGTSPPLYHKSPSFSCVEKHKREQSWVSFSPVWTRKMLFVGWEEIKMPYQMSKKFLFLLGNGGDTWPDGMPRSGTMKVSSEPV
jgi:hypothetical protein